ncbi:MAG: hypothetical protein ABSE20_15960 [Acetobacteraceae bacterium]
MNKSVVTAAVAAFVLGAATTGVILASAQPAPPPGAPPAADGGPMARGPWMGPRGPMGGGMGPGHWAMRMGEHHAHRMEMMRTFALIHRADDRKLTPPDVQKIVEAFLLWNGNHTWKVLDVKPEGDVIGFDLATGQGSVIAHFTMDPKTAHLTRVS